MVVGLYLAIKKLGLRAGVRRIAAGSIVTNDVPPDEIWWESGSVFKKDYKMKFSVVTPVYNGMPALRGCIGSVRGQVGDVCLRDSRIPDMPVESLHAESPSGKRDFYREGADSPDENTTLTSNDSDGLTEASPLSVQHIVQDGGSTDGTVDWLRQYDAETRGRRSEGEGQSAKELNASGLMPNAYSFSYSSERDAGMYDAINKGWAKSNGDILSWLNSDEQYLPGTLQMVSEYFQSHPEVDAVFGDTIVTTADGRPYAARKEIPLRKWYVANGFLYALSCSTFFRRKLWDNGLLKLDTTYRFSSDTDLILRLLDAGVQFFHIKEYLSLFGVEDGRNLSFSPKMALETGAIQKMHGAYPWKIACKGVMLCRRLERLCRGCYRAGPVQYDYALNELPVYETRKHSRLGFRFTYSGFSEDSRND